MKIKLRQKKISTHIELRINNENLWDSDCVKELVSYKSRHYAPKNILINIYNAFIYPHINYGITNWGRTYPTILDELTKCLKKAERITNFRKPI